LAISCCGPRQIVLLKRWSVQQERAIAAKFKASQSASKSVGHRDSECRK
jgi:hypothetical protein